MKNKINLIISFVAWYCFCFFKHHDFSNGYEIAITLLVAVTLGRQFASDFNGKDTD